MFQLLEGDFKVEGWLSQQEESDTIGLGGKYKSLQFIKKYTLDHVRADDKIVNATNSFAISESGAIGISCVEGPSLSVMYIDTDRPPVILSNDMTYRSTTFIKISRKEYLAAADDDDGCLYLWDIESRTSRKVFDPKLPIDKLAQMNICKIDKNTIGYGEVNASLDGSRRVFLLKMDTEELTLSATLKLFTPGDIWNMCHTEMSAGTSCLLLCIPTARCILAVESEDGRTRWEVGKQQMGEEFEPRSICTDQNDCVYVADFGHDTIHLLSSSDGTVIKRFDVGSYYGIQNVFTVRFYDQYLFVEHKIHTQKVKKYAILKFKQIEEL